MSNRYDCQLETTLILNEVCTLGTSNLKTNLAIKEIGISYGTGMTTVLQNGDIPNLQGKQKLVEKKKKKNWGVQEMGNLGNQDSVMYTLYPHEFVK